MGVSWRTTMLAAEKRLHLVNGLLVVFDETKLVRDPELVHALLYSIPKNHGQARGGGWPPERPTHDDIPDTPEELAALIEAGAHAHRIALAHQQVAADFLEPLARRFNQLVREQVPGWILALQVEFNGLVKQLRAQSKKLPDRIDVNMLNWNDARISTAWEKSEGVAFQLDQFVSDRRDMARAGDLEATSARSPVPTFRARATVGPHLRRREDVSWLTRSRRSRFGMAQSGTASSSTSAGVRTASAGS
ncbi:DUF927 domain-containing protein [Streptomyces sp. FXJ1.4098]|nr:DUF927 domain-containing protein [Streptomyces sp. FXJ1.4098]